MIHVTHTVMGVKIRLLHLPLFLHPTRITTCNLSLSPSVQCCINLVTSFVLCALSHSASYFVAIFLFCSPSCVSFFPRSICWLLCSWPVFGAVSTCCPQSGYIFFSLDVLAPGALISISAAATGVVALHQSKTKEFRSARSSAWLSGGIRKKN